MPNDPAQPDPPEADLVALLGSRLCHDLISPIGAIGNGLELLALAGSVTGPEMELIAQSVAAANARVRFYRLAFGQVGDQQRLGASEIAKILTEFGTMGRINYDWQVEGERPRSEVKLACLAMLCLEAALPFGGTIEARETGGHWEIATRSDKLRAEPRLFARLDGTPGDLTPAQVQFALLPIEAARQRRHLSWTLADRQAAIRF